MSERDQNAKSRGWMGKSRGWLRTLLRVAVSLGVLGALLSQREVALEFWATLRGVAPGVMAGAVLWYLAGQWLSALKWHLLLREAATSPGVMACFGCYLAGMFANLFLPSSIGGDALRTALVRQKLAHQLFERQGSSPEALAKSETAQGEAGLSWPEATASVLVERLTGLAALLALILGALILRGAGGVFATGGAAPSRLEAQLLGAALLALFVVAGAAWLAGRTRSERTHVWREALAVYARPQARRVMAVAMALSLAFQASQVVLNIALARAVGLGLPDATFWWLAPMLSLAALLPLSLGGLGVREGAALALVSGLTTGAGMASGGAITPGSVVAWSLLWQVTVWAASLPGAGVVWWATRSAVALQERGGDVRAARERGHDDDPMADARASERGGDD